MFEVSDNNHKWFIEASIAKKQVMSYFVCIRYWIELIESISYAQIFMLK